MFYNERYEEAVGHTLKLAIGEAGLTAEGLRIKIQM